MSLAPVTPRKPKLTSTQRAALTDAKRLGHVFSYVPNSRYSVRQYGAHHYRTLANLVDMKLLDFDGYLYTITDAGKAAL